MLILFIELSQLLIKKPTRCSSVVKLNIISCFVEAEDTSSYLLTISTF